MKAVIASFFMVLSLRRPPRESHASLPRTRRPSGEARSGSRRSWQGWVDRPLFFHLSGRGFVGSLQLLELLIQLRARDVELVRGPGLQLLRGLPELFGLRPELVELPAGGVPRLALHFPVLSLALRARAIV